MFNVIGGLSSALWKAQATSNRMVCACVVEILTVAPTIPFEREPSGSTPSCQWLYSARCVCVCFLANSPVKTCATLLEIS